MVVIPIDDPSDDRVADYVGLTDAAARRQGVVIAEGVLVIRQLLRSPYRPRSLLVTPARLRDLAGDLAALGVAADLPVYLAGREVIGSVVGFDLHRGAVAAADRLAPTALDRLLAGSAERRASPRLVAVVEASNDHENLGALFRNATALGVDAVLLSPSCADPLYRRSVRVSMGHVLHLPFARLDDWEVGLGRLTAAGFTIVALTPDPAALPLGQLDPADPAFARLAILVGAEGPGLTGQALARAHHRARIPMTAGVDSLNLATAAAIAFHHFARQP
ncbi:MAG: TrmH family RNA methyltransferase [Acidimicrobiales bacterium]